MASIESVTGPLDPADLGTVLIHEHLRFRDNATADEFPHLYDEDASTRQDSRPRTAPRGWG